MHPERRAALLLTATTVIWGSTFFTMKIGQEAILRAAPEAGWHAGLLFLAMRFTLAALIFALILPGTLRRMTAAVWRDSFFVSLPGVIGIGLQITALREASSATVAFITSLTVVTVPVIGWIFLRQRLTRALWIGGIISLAGVLVLGGKFGVPAAITLVAAVIFGAQIQLVSHYTRRHEPEAVTMGAFVHSVWTTLAAMLILPGARALLDPDLIAAMFRPSGEGSVLQRWALAWTVPYHALFASVVAFWVLMRFQRDVPATRAAIIYCLEPLFAAVLAWTLNSEPVLARELVGGALIIAGNLACERLRRREVPPSPAPERVPAEAGTPPPVP